MNLQLPRFADANEAIAWLAGASAQAAALIVAVLALRAALGPRLTPGWRLALWTIVLLRLVVPLAVESRWSLAAIGRRVTSIASRADVASATAKPRAAPGEPRVSVTYGPIPGVATPTVAPRVATAPPLPTRWTTRDALFVAWLVGVATMVLRESIGAIRLGRAVRRMRAVDDPVMLSLAARCAREIGVRQRVRLVETDRLRAPAVCGILRPTILVPLDVARTLTPAELRLVLLHELAHVRRDDVLVGAIARLVRAMHWFNPFVWLGVAAFRADRELAADAAVLHVVGDAERRAYGDCLLHVVARVSDTPRHAATLGLFGPSRHLQRRIDMIATGTPSRWASLGRGAIGVVALLAIGGAAALAEPTTRPANDDATLARLARPIAAIDLSGQTLEQAVDAIAKAGGVPLRVEWDALAAIGVSRSSLAKPTSLKNVKPIKALQIVFDVLGPAGGGPSRFDYEVVDDAVWFSTAADIAKRFGGATRTFALDTPADRARNEQVATLIVDTIDSDSWKRNGGTGEIEARAADIVVKHTPRRLAEVARLIDQLNETRGTKQPTAAGLRILAAREAATAPRNAPTTAEAEAIYEKVLPELRFDAVSLTDVIDFLRATTSNPIFVNWKALEREGIDRLVPISVRLTNVKVGKALSIVLDAAGGGRVKLGHTFDEGVITISTRDDLAVNVMTRTYDIRDLLIPIPDFNANNISPPPATRPATTQPTRAEAVRQIVGLIQATIDADSWRANGGKIGAIQELGGQLIVTNTPAVQKDVEAMLVQLRAGRAIQVAVEARFVAVDPTAVPTLLGGRSLKPIQMQRPDAASKLTSTFLDDDQAAGLLRAFELSEAASTLTAPKLTLFNGQHAVVRVETAQAYLSTYTVSVSAAGERKYEPVIEQARTGVTLSVRATASADRQFVTLELDPRTSRLLGLERVPFAGDPGSGLTVQRPNVEETSLATTLSLPSGGTVLLGGAQIAGETQLFGDANATRPATRPESRQLLLFVKARVMVPTP